MEIWLDTCDIQVIAAANRLGIVYGVTINPSILAEASDDHETVINKILDIQDGPIAASIIGVTLWHHLLTVYGTALSTSGVVVCVIVMLFLLTALIKQAVLSKCRVP